MNVHKCMYIRCSKLCCVSLSFHLAVTLCQLMFCEDNCFNTHPVHCIAVRVSCSVLVSCHCVLRIDVIGVQYMEEVIPTLYLVCMHTYIRNLLINPPVHMRRRVTVAVYVCVSGLIFPNSNKSAWKTYRLPQHCNRLI